MSPLLLAVFGLATVVPSAVAYLSARQRRGAPAAGALAFVAGSVAFWSLCELVAALPVPLQVATGAKLALFLGVAGVVAGFHCLSLAVVDRGWRLTGRAAALLSIEPLLLLLVVATNPWHHLFVQRWDVVDGLLGSVRETYGVLFWPHMVYSNALLLAGLTRIFVAAWRNDGGSRRGFQLILAAATLPMVANLLAVTGLTGPLNLTVVGFAMTGVLAYRTVFDRWVSDRVPVAHARILDAVGDAVAVVDVSGTVITTNPAADRLVQRVSGGALGSVCGRPVADVLVGIELQDDAREQERTLLDVQGSGVDLHVRICPLADHRGRRIGWTLVARDVTEIQRQRAAVEQANAALAEANARLSHQLATIEALRADLAEQAQRDPLTGLHNRRYVMAFLDEVEVSHPGGTVSVAILDVDHFKRVNDAYGHPVGDVVLVELARLLLEGAGEGDVVGRHGGEEFVVVMPGVDTSAAVDRVDAIRSLVAGAVVDAGGQALGITISAGVATSRGDLSRAELFQAADAALYRAKRDGRNRVVSAVPV